MNEIKKQVIKGFNVDKATEDQLNDLSAYELIDIILFFREELQRYKQAIKEIFRCLIKANKKGAICDTIWITESMTLWDYIANLLELQGDQNEIENQIIQKCEEVNE